MKKRRVPSSPVVVALTLLLLLHSAGFAQSGSPYDLTWWTMDGGDGLRNGDRYTVEGTEGQPDAHNMTGGNFILYGGFWALANFKPDADPTDLLAQKLEVTQSVQDLNNSVRLVARKRTFVRFHVRSAGGIHRTFAQLRVQINGKPDIWLSPINIDRGHINVGNNPNRAALNDAFLFELPNNYAEGTVTLTGEVNPETPWRFREPAEQDVSNNRTTTTVSFENVPTANLVVYGIGYGNAQNPILPAQLHYDHLSDWLGRAYPLSNLRIQQRTRAFNVAQFDGLDCWYVINPWLESVRLQDVAGGSVPAGTHYYGIVDDRGDVMEVSCAFGIPAMVASGSTGTPTPARYRSGWDRDQSYGDWLGGHELGHAYGRRHTRCLGGEGGPDPNYPHPNGRISPTLSGDSAIYGFDTHTLDIYGPNWHDVMSYCEHLWLSDYTYEALLDFFQRTPVVASAEQQSSEPMDRLLVTGAIDPQTNQAKLQPLYVLPKVGDVQPRTPGEYAIVLRNNVGSELARYPFTPIEGDGYSSQPENSDEEQNPKLIAELVPFVVGTAKVEIVKGESTLASVSAGVGKPSVTLSPSNLDAASFNETITLSWQASDPDNDPLLFVIQYSADGGKSWQTVAQNIQGNSTMIDGSKLVGGSAALFRVLASDGINTTIDQSDAAFNAPNHVPTVEMVQPAASITLAISQTLALAGNAYDIDTGTMPDNQLRWTSNLDGLLGTGAQLSTASLSQGTHILTLQADDGVGGVATDTIQVTVVENPNRLPVVADGLLVGPARLSLNTTTNTISATLSVANQNGLNVITWDVASSQPWLQVSKTSGTTPLAIVASVDPATTPKGVTLATLTFTSPQLSGQKVEVQVEVQNGQTESALNNKVYLPVVSR